MITYIDFLEALLWIAAAYPFNEMPDNEIYSLPDQVQWVVDKLSQAYSFLVDVFNKHLDDRDKAMNF